MATHSSTCLENPMDREAWRVTVCGVTKGWMDTTQVLGNDMRELRGLGTHLMALWVWGVIVMALEMILSWSPESNLICKS